METSPSLLSEESPPHPSRPRILVVDDEPEPRQDYQELLEFWGYEPVLALGKGEDLLQDAIQKAQNARCPLALVDMRLQDGTDPNDISGLNLIPRLRPTRAIVVSAYGGKSHMRLATERGALTFLGKEEGPLVLKEALENALHQLCASQRDLAFDPAEALVQVANVLAAPDAAYLEEQVQDTLARLFPEAKHLKIEYLGDGPMTAPLTSVPRPRSVILKVTADDHQPVIVKLARARKMRQEVERYRKYIQGYIFAHLNPQLDAHEILWDVGGARYTYLGSSGDLQTFAKYYASASMEEIQRSLRQFFTQSWGSLYRKTQSRRRISPFEAYCEVWGRSWYDERLAHFEPPDPALVMGAERWQALGVPEPVTWLKRRLSLEQEASPLTQAEITLAITHGDLHGDNLLIDKKGNTWIIDFERSGPGPNLQDFAELEADILNRLAPCQNDFQTFYRLCLYAARPERLEATQELEQAADTDIVKAMQTISALRLLAHEITGESETRLYLWGVLLNTLFRITILNPQRDLLQQQRSMMLASILCHRLDHWGEPWPPAAWPPA